MTHPACLIICLTPLQALTAQSLIRAHAPTPFDLLMLCYPEADNAKFHHYFRQTAALCRQAHYAVLPVRRWAHWRSLQGLRRQLLPHYAVIFAASIDNLNVQYLLENLSYTQLETFDDGSGNLTPSGILYRNKPHSLWQRSLRRLLGVRRDTEDFRRRSSRHHTLYPGLPNIATPTVAVNLWPQQAAVANVPTRQRRILLGQPAYAQAADNIAFTQQLLHTFAIEHYFPHPREDYRIGDANYIDSDLIFEDYLLTQIQAMPDTAFHIYHLASTAALNVCRFPHVTVHAIRPALPLFRQPVYAHLYTLMAHMGMAIHAFPPEGELKETAI